MPQIASQYNRWIEIATGDGMLANTIAEYGKNSSIASLANTDLGKVQAMISKEVSDAYSNAKQILIASYRDWETDRKSTRLNSSHSAKSRMPSSA